MQFAVAQFSGVRGGSVPIAAGGENRERPCAAGVKIEEAAVRESVANF